MEARFVWQTKFRLAFPDKLGTSKLSDILTVINQIWFITSGNNKRRDTNSIGRWIQDA